MTDELRELRFLGQAILAAREERELSREDLAAAAGIDPARLAALEAGEVDPDFELLLRIADALDTRVAALVLEAEAQRQADPGQARAIRWRARRSSSPSTRDLEAGLTLTYSGKTLRRLASWLFRHH